MLRTVTLSVCLVCILFCSPIALAHDTIKIAYVSPSMESVYWGQYVEIGARKAAMDIEEEFGVRVDYSVHGPAAEAETDAFLNILEAVVASRPDIIALGNLIPDATAPIVAQATAMGIHVNLISIGVPLPADQFGTLFYCDQPQQGILAAEAFYECLQKKGLPMDGLVGIHMSVVVPVLEEKIQAFRDRLSELAPDLVLLDTQYNDNVVEVGISLVENQFATYGDKLVGFFAGNNVTGVAVSRAVAASGKSDQLVNVAIDSDDAQIKSIRDGNLDALIVQTPFDQAHNAVMNAYKHFAGLIKESPSEVNLPAVVVTPENIDDPGMDIFLDPTLLDQ